MRCFLLLVVLVASSQKAGCRVLPGGEPPGGDTVCVSLVLPQPALAIAAAAPCTCRGRVRERAGDSAVSTAPSGVIRTAAVGLVLWEMRGEVSVSPR